jgi:hypothetical protein
VTEEERLWKKNGWIARVIKNEDDDGWAVEMTRVGDAEPALVGPWVMGRDKKTPDPKIIEATAYYDTASDNVPTNVATNVATYNT